MKNYNHCAAYDDSSTVWSKGVLYCVLLLDYRQQQLRTLEGMRLPGVALISVVL